MSMHGSATAPEETPHETETTTIPISDALRRRAQSVINDSRTDPQWRSILRYALEVDDPWLADIVRRADAGERIIDTVDFSLEPQFNEDDSHEEKFEALAGIISRAGHESAAALFVLMGTLENSRDPKLFANAVKHFAFTHCSMSNLYGMVDAQLSHSRQQTTIKVASGARYISRNGATAQRNRSKNAAALCAVAPLREKSW